MTPKTILALVDIAHKDSGQALLSFLNETFGDAALHVAYVMPYGFYNYVEPYVSEESQKAAADRARGKLAELIQSAGLTTATQHVLRGGIGEQAVLEAKELKADLVAVNATRLDSHHTTLGTHAAQIARHCGCSVLLYRAP
jgi:nucleotide-binding universal stress UspA family protein